MKNLLSIIEYIDKHYPDCPVFRIPGENPTEIVCEIEKTTIPDQSTAIAFIEESKPHYHNRMTEVYIVEEGEVTVTVNTVPIYLKKGDVLLIRPREVHYAHSQQGARVRVVAAPAWTPEDHILT